MSPPAVYLDNNSTTPIDPRVVEAMTRAWRECSANPASQHAAGRHARRRLEEAREGILALLGAKPGGMDADQIVFTSGGTEANNLALFGLAAARTKPVAGASGELPARLLVSPLEHPSVAAASAELFREGCVVERLPVTAVGVVTARESEAFAAPAFVSVMLANNETGVIQPVAEIAVLLAKGNLLHTDSVQAVGKIPVNFRALGVDAMTVAPHKFHGPLGIGALILRHGIRLQPQLFGGFQQGGLRPGTENVALAVGFHEALRLAVAELPERAARMRSLRDELERQLRGEFPDLVVIGEGAERLPNTLCVAFPGINRQQLVIALDLSGVACSTGSACASGSSEPSRTLLAMGLPLSVVEGAVRFSLGAFTTPEEVTEGGRRILNTAKHLRSLK